MKRFIYILAAFALMGAVSCQPDEEVAVHASFTTDKESYDVGDPVVLTNTSTAENALIAICKWELGKGVVSYETTPENISYDQAGEYVIKLTVTSDRGAKKSSFEKTIRVVDNNIRPVADFTWSPEKVVAGEPVQFTDRSTDEDGEVVAWEWKFGTTTSDKQNPEFTFAAQGATEVSLTVTDNKKGRNTKTVTIDVGRGAISLDLLWSYPYDDTKDAYVFGTSPAVSPDGEYVYVTSTGYSLVCFTKAGERLWAFDIGKDGASAENNSGSIKVQSPTPSVDEDGTVYALAGFNEPNKGAGGSAFYAVSGGAGGGSQVWHVNTGVNTSFRFLSPAVTEKYLFIVARNVPSGHQNFPGLRQIVGRPGGRAARQRRLLRRRAAAQKRHGDRRYGRQSRHARLLPRRRGQVEILLREVERPRAQLRRQRQGCYVRGAERHAACVGSRRQGLHPVPEPGRACGQESGRGCRLLL